MADQVKEFLAYVTDRYPLSAPALNRAIELKDARIAALETNLRDAAAILRKYEAYHRAKGTEDSTAKAEVNAGLAARFEATIAKATP